MMKQFFGKTMKNIATYVELVLSAFLVFVIAILIIKLVGQCFFDIWHDKLELEYYMEYAMSLCCPVVKRSAALTVYALPVTCDGIWVIIRL